MAMDIHSLIERVYVIIRLYHSDKYKSLLLVICHFYQGTNTTIVHIAQRQGTFSFHDRCKNVRTFGESAVQMEVDDTTGTS